MTINEAKAILEANGYMVAETMPVKNGRPRNALVIRFGIISPILYEESLENIKTADQLISIVTDSIDRVPYIDTDNLLTRDNLKKNVVSCVRPLSDDDTIVKYPVDDGTEEYVKLRVGDFASVILKPEHLAMAEVTKEEAIEWGRANLRKTDIPALRAVHCTAADVIYQKADGSKWPLQ